MIVQFGSARIELVLGDITTQQLDIIVNAANSQLAGGGGVDGAIHDAAGPEIMKELRQRYPDGCPTGSAVVTSGGKLTSQYIFHAVGPIWQGGSKKESQLLESAYQTCLSLAEKHQCKTLAFPSISTGVYRYPLDLAAEIALRTVAMKLESSDELELVRFVLFDQGTFGGYARVLETMLV
ncbi:O-acetyl-ADP-ribose deacetylase [Gimesia aquarii]|uniref:O-acetyl-ADP-ribose deacetylase n=1 Tax=Gimesia aquarii TaxID=2527964 RepID=A0A517VX49_9PLAN|nr:O-acetyl-ADP-ribose deacetylase [Gimesia aquarii]QDT97576.1 O-acetyl-ADP-ribose deacetylase [Gimesia aquarii]